MTNIHTHHLRCTVLQQTIGEAAGRLADVQTTQTFNRHTCGLQSASQFQTAARYKPRLGVIQQLQFAFRRQQDTVFLNALPSVQWLSPLHTRGNQTLGL